MSQKSNILESGSKRIVVEMAGLEVTDNPSSVLVTYALGSCIAVCIHDPMRKAVGMVHYMLPKAKASPEKAAAKPAMFGDTGIPLLFEKMLALGCTKEAMVIKLVGGGIIHDDKGIFNIGPRNHAVAKKLFWRSGLLIAAEDVGGRKSRTVRLFANDGRIVISSQGKEEEL